MTHNVTMSELASRMHKRLGLRIIPQLRTDDVFTKCAHIEGGASYF